MKPVFQKGMSGCWEACIASILEIPLEEVPDFDPDQNGGLDSGTGEWFDRTSDWLQKNHGLYLVAAAAVPELMPRGYHIITGKSPRGNCDHAVVGRDGAPAHDPYPGGGCRLLTTDDYVLFVSCCDIASK